MSCSYTCKAYGGDCDCKFDARLKERNSIIEFIRRDAENQVEMEKVAILDLAQRLILSWRSR